MELNQNFSDQERVICPHCKAENTFTDMLADGALDDETECQECDKYFKYYIEFDPVIYTEVVKNDS